MSLPFLAIMFRSIAIISGIILLIFSVLIYRKTRNATGGWFYLSLFGISLFLWSVTSLVFGSFDSLRLISGIFFLLLIGTLGPYAYIRLADDFWIQKPKWITGKNFISFLALIFAILFAYNIARGLGGARHILSIVHQYVAIALLLTSIPTFYLMIRSRKLMWGTAFFACLVVGLGLNIGQYASGCCADKIPLEPVCGSYSLDYVSAHDLPCFPGLVAVGMVYQIFLLLGVLLVDVSFILVWKSI